MKRLAREKAEKATVISGAAIAEGLRNRKPGGDVEAPEEPKDDAPFEIEMIFDLVDEDESNTLDREELRE